MSLKLLIFDLDGTLVDSSIDITNAINYAIEPYGFGHVTVKETISLVGEGITRLMEKIINKNITSSNSDEQPSAANNSNIDKDILVARFLEYYSLHLTDNTIVYPGVRETLARLCDYRKAVISNKREALTVKILDELNLISYFNIVVGSDTTPERKPSPVPIYYVLSKLNIKNSEAAIIGDSNFDIEAGKNAGITTIAVTYGFKPAESLKGADFLISHIEELELVGSGL